ncbi:hypothetical protein DL98DRAFT_598516 [Cadophora sp. DSE1049]|nr:hypothetical protein DL98DRAFT_598516 [Cadophora sp. DSE1049]
MLDAIKTARLDISVTFYADIAGWIDDYQGEKILCTSYPDEEERGRGCDALYSGRKYIMSCSKCGIWPAPQPPYTGHSISSLIDDIEGLRIKSMRDYTDDGYLPEEGGEGHGLRQCVMDTVTELDTMSDGFDIEDFEKHKRANIEAPIELD